MVLPSVILLSNKRLFIIKYLCFRILLLTKLKLEYDIPIIFTNYDWKEYKDIFNKANIDVVFDCTGGKLQPDIFKNIDTKWISSIKKVNKQVKNNWL